MISDTPKRLPYVSISCRPASKAVAIKNARKTRLASKTEGGSASGHPGEQPPISLSYQLFLGYHLSLHQERHSPTPSHPIVSAKKVGRTLNIFYVTIRAVWGIDGGHTLTSRWTGDDLEQGTGGTTLSGCCAMQLLPLDETSRCVPNCGPLWAGVDIFGSAGQELVSALLSQPIASVQPPDRVFSPWLSCCWEAVYCSWRTYLSLDKTEFLWAQAMIRPLSPILRCMAF